MTATAVVGTLAGGPDEWYEQLSKPSFQPPPVVFPVVWPLLYAGIAVSSADTLDELADADRVAYSRALAVNLALNGGWTWLFFRARRPWLATAGSAALVASTADLVRRSPSDRARALLAPYLGWTGFATVLAGSVAWLNRRR